MADAHRSNKAPRGLLGRLARDTRGNTLAIMGAALIPLAGMVGGGLDISRMYIVKTRLQHACDAGALAGRKSMAAGTWAYNNYAARTAANQFFDSNIQASPYGAESLTKTYTEDGNGKVSGTASAVLPMTLMRIFGRTTETLTVTCDAEMRLPNTDIMFVLDTTGSMDDKAVSTDTDDKITSLKKSVKCFYEVVANLDTTASCTTTPTGAGVANTVQIRFGFMPYATNVNVGKLLPTSYFANSWPYQSRSANTHEETNTTWNDSAVTQTGTSSTQTGSWSSWDNASSSTNTTATSTSNCQSKVPASSMSTSGSESGRRDEATTGTNPRTTTWNTRQTANWLEYSFRDYRSSDGRCRFYVRDRDGYFYRYYSQTSTGTTTTTTVFDNYTYSLQSKDISGLKNGTSWNSSFQLPVGTQGAMKTISWGGCIEERTTTRATSYDPIPAGAHDLQIDELPVASDADTLWGPVLPDLIYSRRVQWNGYNYTGSLNYDPVTTADEYVNYSGYYCPREARKLQSWSTASTFESYVDSLTPSGNTYHDIGLLWGARFMSPDGIFASENAQTPSGGDIARHLIFMTDGEACTGTTNYTAYGVAWWDRRQTATNTAPTDGCLTTGTLTTQVNARMAALCTAVKNKNITLWVIWFGASNTTVENMLTSCATSGRFFAARNSTQLQQTFSSIASQISQLRLTK